MELRSGCILWEAGISLQGAYEPHPLLSNQKSCEAQAIWMNLQKALWSSRGIVECSLERLMLKLKLQYFDHLMQRTDSLEKTLMMGKIEGGGEGDDRGWDGWMASPTWWTWVRTWSRSWWGIGKASILQSMESQSWTQLSDWTELNGNWLSY